MKNPNKKEIGLKSCKGQAMDIFFMVFLIVVGVIGLFTYSYVTSVLKTSFFNNETAGENATQYFTESTSTALNVADWIVPFIYVIFTVAAAILSYSVQGNPAFFVFMILLMVVIIALSMFFSDTLKNILEEDLFVSYRGDWSKTLWVVNNLALLMVISTTIISIAFFINVG